VSVKSVAELEFGASRPERQPSSRFKRFLVKVLRLSRTSKKLLLSTIVCSGLAVLLLLLVELKTSFWQSLILASLTKEIGFKLEAGPSSAIVFPPASAPYDRRLGYSLIPKATEALQSRGFEIASQARMSDRMLKYSSFGLPATYANKTRAGLSITDRYGQQMFSVVRPEQGYIDFTSIPKIVVDSLTFIENKEILDQHSPYKNPAVEWDRFLRASIENLYSGLNSTHSAPGGSTIATQLEKYRHSPGGRTNSVKDKLTQMFSASLKAYRYGRDTLETRKLVLLSYINSIPLAAFPGYGEVSGLADGLNAWFAEDFNNCNQILGKTEVSSSVLSAAEIGSAGLCFRKVMSLFVAHRRPSYYLNSGRDSLSRLVDSYIRLMFQQGLITEQIADAALEAKIFYRGGSMEPAPVSFLDRKAVNTIRSRLSSFVGVDKLYELDHFDLAVATTFDKQAHQQVTSSLQKLSDPQAVQELGLKQDRLLGQGDPAKVVYSLTLFETEGGVNKVRVQTDNFDGPFNINSGSKLDLGSTAKLRTLVSYLKILEDLYLELSPLRAADREKARAKKIDPIGDWAIQTLNGSPNISLENFLRLSLERSYSASPAETFYTGGGIHRFNNFKKEDNGRVVSLKVALRESINLPFVRLMRDIVRFYSARQSGKIGKLNLLLSPEAEQEMRKNYLERFADFEGTQFMSTFYSQYKGLATGQAFEKLAEKVSTFSYKQAALYRFVYADNSLEQFSAFLRLKNPGVSFKQEQLEKLYTELALTKFDLNDRGYILKVHPLELWLVSYLEKNQGASLSMALKESQSERQHVYKWLFKPSKRKAQDLRIKKLIEQDSFLPILELWQQSGYPFDKIVPSFATAIGSSGDRPESLAELMGVIVNGGKRLPTGSIEKLAFADETPYETNFQRKSNSASDAKQVFSLEAANVLKEALIDVVQNGTARRLKEKLTLADGRVLEIGGKTGTGDHQFKHFSPGGQLLSSRVVSRTATFAFFIGDKHFGVVTAHVKGPAASKYNFTSGLAAEVLKMNLPNLAAVLAS
jgi:membrane peptidoglycan carboxypeptidase